MCFGPEHCERTLNTGNVKLGPVHNDHMTMQLAQRASSVSASWGAQGAN